jgi:hypothetical protein
MVAAIRRLLPYRGGSLLRFHTTLLTSKVGRRNVKPSAPQCVTGKAYRVRTG